MQQQQEPPHGTATPKLKRPNDKLNRQVTVRNLPQIATWEDLRNNLTQHLFYTLLRDRHDATSKDLYRALGLALRDQMAAMWVKTQRRCREQNKRIAYYLSMEFYLGRMMKNAVVNLGLEKILAQTATEVIHQRAPG